MKILVVDDDVRICEVVSESFLLEGFYVDTATNGLEGLKLLQKGDYDIMFCDVEMPELNGIELLQRISEMNIKVTVVMLTGVNDVTMAVEAMKLGAVTYLVKPITEAVLQAAVAEAKQHREEMIRKSNMIDNMIDNMRDLSERLPSVSPVKTNIQSRFDIEREDSNEAPNLCYGDICLDQGRFTAYVSDTEIKLTPREYIILEMLVQAQGTVISYQKLAMDLENRDLTVSEARRLLSSHISNLRKKIAATSGTVKLANRHAIGFYLQ